MQSVGRAPAKDYGTTVHVFTLAAALVPGNGGEI